MIQAFLDDSGVKGTHPIFTFAGFIGRAERWAKFSDEWSRWLAAPPSIKYLKMQEAAKLDGQFRHWHPEERNKKLRGCIAILKSYPQLAIHVTVDIADYQRVIAPDMPALIRNPYFMAFFGILSGVCYEMIDTQVPEQVEVIFDQHSIFQPRINVWYPVMQDMISLIHDEALARALPSSPIFKPDEEFVPLQASDVIAWLFRTSLSGIRTEFEWIAAELSPVIPMSKYATFYAGDRIEQVRTLSYEMQKRMTPDLLRRWRAMLPSSTFRKKKGKAKINA